MSTATTPTTITLPYRTRGFNWRTGDHQHDYRAVPGLGWVAVWSEQDGPGPCWYRLRDADGHERDATRAEYEASFSAHMGGRGVAYARGWQMPQYIDPAFAPLDTLPADQASAILARIVAADYPHEAVYLSGSSLDVGEDRDRARVYILRATT